MLQGTLTDGSPFRCKVTARTRDLRIDEPKLATIDLAPLANSQLRKLYIRSSALTQLDLSPLAATPLENLQLSVPGATFALPAAKLTHLTVSGGPPTIDFAPIATAALTHLTYFNTPLATADLQPLARCTALEIMWLSQSALRELDLRPLADLPALDALELSRSKLERVELGDHGFASLANLHLHGNPLHALTLCPLPALRVLNLPVTLEGRVDIAPRDDLDVRFR